VRDSAARPLPAAEPDAPAPAGRRAVYLHAGQLAVFAEPAAITTILGSCVSVCLLDPERGVGGMNHFLLPLHVERERSLRFGTVAVPQLVDDVVRAGGRRDALQAKVFGGASVIGAFSGGRQLGRENVDLALRLLADERIPVLDQDVGGSKGRKVIFHVDDGAVWVRQL
jgi:chemotaxis protein CheD